MKTAHATNTYSIIKEQSEKFGDKTYATFSKSKRSLSFRQLLHGVQKYSQYFTDSGLTRDESVALVAKNDLEGLVAYFSLLSLGLLVYRVNETSPPNEIFRYIQRFDCDYIIHDHSVSKLIPCLSEDSLCMARMTVIELPNVATLNGKQISDETEAQMVAVSDQNPGICVFTSGSTGEPKGIVSSQKSLLFAANLLRCHGLTSDDRVLSVTPLSGTNGQVFTLWTPLVTGGSTVVYQGLFTAYGAFSAVEEFDVTWFNGTPTHISIFVNDFVNRRDCDYRKLKFFRSASAPLPSTLKQQFESQYAIPIIETMGLSEMTGMVFANPVDQAKQKPGSVGLSIQTEVKVTDDKGHLLESGDVGELQVRSDGLMLGYHNDATSTQAAIEDGWLKTGDLGSIDDEGFIFVKGRKKDIIIVGGHNVALKEVDEVLYRNQHVLYAVSFGVDDQLTGEKIVGCVVPKRDGFNDETDILAFCRENLAAYKCPSEIRFCKSVPLGGSGKILRHKAKQLFLENRLDG